MAGGWSSERRWVPWALALALAVLACAVHLGVASHQLINYDDDILLDPKDPGLSAGLSATGLGWAFTSVNQGNWMPVTRLTWLIDVSLFGFGARWFLLGNVFYHVVATVLLFGAFRVMTRDSGRSALLAALFAVHPLHVESVAWASERKDVVCGAFWMATLLAYAGYVRRPRPGRYLLVFGALALSLLAKPMAVTLPFVLLLLDVWPLARIRTESLHAAVGSLREPLLEKVPLFALAAASSVATIVTQRHGDAVRSLELFPLRARLANAAIAPWVYVRKFVWPTDLAVFYPHPGDGVSYPAAGLGIAALAIVTLLAVRAVRRRPYVTVGWLWFLVPLLPVIGILQVGFQAYADRYMYAPLVGLSILIVWGGSELASAMRLGASLQLGAAAALVVAFSVGTVRQVRHWQDSEAVFRHALDVTSENWLAHQNLGGVELRRKNIDAAGMHLAESVRIEPRNSATQIGYGSVLLYQGRRREGLEAMRKGVVFAAEIGEDLRAKLLAEIDGELSGGPPADTAAVIDRNLASADGLAMMEKTVRLRPQTPGIQGELGVALLRAGRNEEAEVVLREAIQREPENPTWRASHADVLVRLGRGPDAAAAYREALRLRSPWPEIENNLALLLASSSDPSLRDPAEAVRLAEAAVSGLGREDAGSLDTLAAAYEAAGRRKDALAAAREALTRAEAGGDPDAIAAVQSRIDALGGSPP